MEGYIYLILIVIVAVVFAVQSYRSNKEKKARLNRIIDENFGNVPKREYSDNEMKRISSLYRCLLKKDEGIEHIDDITWNDLDMDEVFKKINNTYSSVGEEYLYYLLRTPRDIEKLKEFNSLTEEFLKDEDNAKELQKNFSKLGRSKNTSFFEFIHRLGDLGKRSNIIHYIQIIAFIASVVVLLIEPPVGIAFFIVILAYNVISYYKQKFVIEHYFDCFKYLVNVVIASEKIEKLLGNSFLKYKEEIIEINKQLSSLKKGLFLISDGVSGDIAEIIMDYVRMILHLDIIKFNSMLKTTINHMEEIDRLYLCLGRIETAICVASFRKYLLSHYGACAIPEIISDNKLTISFENIYHPLIENPVKNSLSENTGVLLTGSNASGKSTFLKTVAINAILSRTIYVASADSMKLSPFSVYSSMALKDDLKNNESYYIVEIKALKRIIDASKNNKPMLCFVDEVLRGTNTVERIAASAEILKSFSGGNVICFAATHDIELTHILEKEYSNYHFEETVLDDDISFNYKLNKGRATTRNAIKLLKIIGYDESIIESAQKLADVFMNTGKW